MRVEAQGQVVVKAADSQPDRDRLGREASMLRALAHPGIVVLVGVEGDGAPDGPDRLLLRRVIGRPLADVGRQSPGAVSGWGAAVATVVADIHDLGYVHGAITADHVLIDERGRPVLCGFGAATRLDAAATASGRQAGDVRAIARLIVERLPEGERALRRTLSAWATEGRRTHGGARALARALVARVPDARIEDPDEAECAPEVMELPRSVRRRPRARVVGAAAAAVVMAVVVGLGLADHRTNGPRRSATVALGPDLMRVASGEDPLTVIGRWRCGPYRPAVLDVSSGSVWIFTAWPAPNTSRPATLAARVSGATGLGVAAAGSGCDRLVVLRADRPDLSVPLHPGSPGG
jgi:tRNA A-37 threonylcarbamoyl transferase component Bud32